MSAGCRHECSQLAHPAYSPGPHSSPPGSSAPIPGTPLHSQSPAFIFFWPWATVHPGLSVSPGRCPLSHNRAALVLDGCPAPGWGRPWLPGPASPDLLGVPNPLHTPTPGSQQPLHSPVNRQ